MDSSDSGSDSDSERRVRTNSDAFYDDDDPDDGDVADYLDSLALHPPPLVQSPPPDPDHIPCEICRRMVSFATYTDHIEVCLMQTSVHMIGQRNMQQQRMRTSDGGMRVTFTRNRTEDDIIALEMATRVLGMSLMPSMTNEYEYNLWLQDRMGGSVNVGVTDKEGATTKIEDPAEVPEDAVCTICIGPPEAPVRKTACNHYFCQGCLFKWLDTSRKCPNCAHVLSGS